MGKRKRRMERKEAHAVRGKTTVTGTFSASAAGFGFVRTESGEVFIPPQFVNGAMDADTVEAVITDPHNRLGPAGKVKSVLTRGREFLVGEMLDGHSVRPLNRVLPSEIAVSGSLKDARRGDWVRLRLLKDGGKHTEKLKGSVEERIDRAATIRGDLKALASEYDVNPPYSPEKEAAALRIRPFEVSNRVDCSSKFTVTIDPRDAKDFDDAVSVEDLSLKEWEIGVHIADVAVWVRPGSAFDREAEKRCFSSYIPGMFRPMLPKSLTSKISLRAGELSFAHTVLLRVRKWDGAVVGWKRFRSTVRVDHRLNYDEVENAIQGNPPENWSEELKTKVLLLNKIAVKMRRWRTRKEAFLRIRTVEQHIVFDDTADKILGLEPRTQRAADCLVEEFMLAANTAVAMEMSENKIPALYRIHPEPDGEKLNEFSEFAAAVTKKTTGDLTNRVVCNEYLDFIQSDARAFVLTSAFLKAMMRASYATAPGLHYGLGKLKYLHFTSPIRRYPDLTVHQQLLAKDTNTRMRSNRMLEKTAATCSHREEINDEAYFAACDRLKLHFLKESGALENGELYEGVIIKTSNAGMMCDVPSIGLRGFVPGRFIRMPRKSKYKIGDFIFLHLDSIDFAKGSAVFKPSL